MMIRRGVGFFFICFGLSVILFGFLPKGHKQIHALSFNASAFLIRTSNQLANSSAFVQTLGSLPFLESFWAGGNGNLHPVILKRCGVNDDCVRLCENSLWKEKDAQEREAFIQDYLNAAVDAVQVDHAIHASISGSEEATDARVIISGSSTVFKLSRHMARCYLHEAANQQTQPPQQTIPRFQISSVGTTGNLNRFCNGLEDLRNASERLVRDKFAYHCGTNYEAIDGKVVELKVAQDAITVVVDRSNPAALTSSLSTEQVKQVLSDGRRWSQVDSTWPGREIVRFYPGSASGTLHVMGDRLYNDGGRAILSATNVRPHENDQWAANQIVGNDDAVGYFGHAFYAEYADLLVTLPLNGVTPAEIHQGGDYPLVRNLYLYTTVDKLCENPSLRSYLRYYLFAVDAYVGALGYFPYQPGSQQGENASEPISDFLSVENLPEFDALWKSVQQQRGESCG